MDNRTDTEKAMDWFLNGFHDWSKERQIWENPRLDYLRAQMIAYEFQQYQRRKPMQVTMEGKYQTKGDLNIPSKPVRILAIDRITPDNPSGRKWPVVGLYTDENGAERQASWSINGEFDSTYSALDLVSVPERQPVVHQMWAVMKSNDEITYNSYSKQDAEIHCNLFAHETVRLIQWNT